MPLVVTGADGSYGFLKGISSFEPATDFYIIPGTPLVAGDVSNQSTAAMAAYVKTMEASIGHQPDTIDVSGAYAVGVLIGLLKELDSNSTLAAKEAWLHKATISGLTNVSFGNPSLNVLNQRSPGIRPGQRDHLHRRESKPVLVGRGNPVTTGPRQESRNMAIPEKIKMLSSDISHMPLHLVWMHSGVAEKHGFELTVDAANAPIEGREPIAMRARARLLLEGEYQFLSGLHHEPFSYRAQGDRRFVYLAQAQNEWTTSFIVQPDIETSTDLQGRRVIVSVPVPCVYGNIRRVLKASGADVEKIRFDFWRGYNVRTARDATDELIDGAKAARRPPGGRRRRRAVRQLRGAQRHEGAQPPVDAGHPQRDDLQQHGMGPRERGRDRCVPALDG